MSCLKVRAGAGRTPAPHVLLTPPSAWRDHAFARRRRGCSAEMLWTKLLKSPPQRAGERWGGRNERTRGASATPEWHRGAIPCGGMAGLETVPSLMASFAQKCRSRAASTPSRPAYLSHGNTSYSSIFAVIAYIGNRGPLFYLFWREKCPIQIPEQFVREQSAYPIFSRRKPCEPASPVR